MRLKNNPIISPNQNKTKREPFRIPLCDDFVPHEHRTGQRLRCKCINSCVVISDVCRFSQYHPSPINAIHPHYNIKIVEMRRVELRSCSISYTVQQTYNISIYSFEYFGFLISPKNVIHPLGILT